jgi:DNA-binding NarL/FixJ family response regulator
VTAGDALLAPSVTRRLIERFVQTSSPDSALRTRLGLLSPREAEVLRLVAQGRTNAEIARELFVTDATVKTHVARMLGKLGARDRIQAIVMAYEGGFVRPGG